MWKITKKKLSWNIISAEDIIYLNAARGCITGNSCFQEPLANYFCNNVYYYKGVNYVYSESYAEIAYGKEKADTELFEVAILVFL